MCSKSCFLVNNKIFDNLGGVTGSFSPQKGHFWPKQAKNRPIFGVFWSNFGPKKFCWALKMPKNDPIGNPRKTHLRNSLKSIFLSF